jgi:sialidase-1
MRSVLLAYDSGGGGDPVALDSFTGLNALACFHWPPKPELIAAAHARGIDVIRATGINTSLIHTAASRAAMVSNLSASVLSVGGDGINIDEESYAGEPADFTSLVRELRAALPPPLSVSLAVGSYPINPLYTKIKYRTGLNWTAVAPHADYLVVMGYDLPYIEPCSHVGNCSQPPLWPPLSNAPLPGLIATVEQFGRLGVPRSSLVMALPWYGRDYPCAASAGACKIETPSGPWPCDGCARHLPSAQLIPRVDFEGAILQHAGNASYEPVSASRVFDYRPANGSGQRRQVWYDDARTLATKSSWARGAGLRGAGVYAKGMVNITAHPQMWSGVSAPWAGTGARETSLVNSELFVGGQGGYACYRLPNLVELPSGHLLAVVQGHKYDCSDSGRMDILSRTSTDNGVSWSAPRLVLSESSPASNVTLGTPTLVVDQTGDPPSGVRAGTIYLFVCRSFRQLLLLTSADGGASWSPPVDLSASLVPASWTGVWTGLPQGIQLDGGRLVVCANHAFGGSAGRGGTHSYAIYSDDHGATWRNGAAVRAANSSAQHTGECSLAQAGGRVWMYSRVWWDDGAPGNGKSTRALAVSADGGASFSDARTDAFVGNPGTDTQGAMVFSRGRFYVGSPWGRGHFPRRNYTVLVSDAVGGAPSTWRPLVGANPLWAGAAEYSALMAASDGTLWVLYERSAAANSSGGGTEALRLTQLQLPWQHGEQSMEQSQLPTVHAASSGATES